MRPHIGVNEDSRRRCDQRKSLWEDEGGVTTLEYALLLALIVAVCVVSYQRIGIVAAESVSASDGAAQTAVPARAAADPGVTGPNSR